MNRRKMFLGFVLVSFLSVTFLAPSIMSQTAKGPQKKQRPRMSAEERQKNMAERVKKALEVTDEQWKSIEPKVTKVMTLSRQARRSPTGRGSRNRREQGDRGGKSNASEKTEIEKSTQALRKVLKNKKAKSNDIAKSLKALRTAHQEAEKQLAVAQADLSKTLSVRQQAQLVLMRYLK